MKKFWKKLSFSLLSFSLLVPVQTFAEEKTPGFDVNAEAAILMNAKTGEVIFEKNADTLLPPASVTKVMNMALASEEMKKGRLQKDDKISISKKAWQTGGSRMFLEVGSEVPAWTVFQGMAIVSGNDAAVAMAEHISGTTDEYVKLMNKKAKSLGMTQTTFETVNGLPSGGKNDVTTARDLGKLGVYYANTFPENFSVHSTTQFKFKSGKNWVVQNNSNSLLDTYEGANGLKTGWISGHYNMIATAVRGDVSLVAVVLKSKSDAARAQSARKLFDYGFSQYETFNKGKKGDEVANINVFKSSNFKEVPAVLAEDVNVTVHIKDKENIKVSYDLPPYLIGGKTKGEVIGQQITVAGDKTYKTDLILTKDIEKSGLVQSFFDSIAILFTWVINLILD